MKRRRISYLDSVALLFDRLLCLDWLLYLDLRAWDSSLKVLRRADFAAAVVRIVALIDFQPEEMRQELDRAPKALSFYLAGGRTDTHRGDRCRQLRAICF